MESRSDFQKFTREDLAEARVEEQRLYRQVGSYHMEAPSSNSKVEMIQETYRLLAVGVFTAMVTAWFASRSIPTIKFLVSGPGLFISFMAMNFVPSLARGALGGSRQTGIITLALDGLLSGLAISPLVFIALMVSGMGQDAPNLVQSALVVTGFAFLGISGYVHKTGANYNWRGGIWTGLLFTGLGLMGLTIFMPGMSVFHYLLLGVVGILGTMQLLYGTSKTLNDPDFKDPISGALILFAGLFNLFQVVLSLLISGGRDRD